MTNLWRAWIGGHTDSSPALSDGMLFIGTRKGDLVAVTTNGVVRWTFHADGEFRASPAVGADGVVYAGSRDRNFYAVNPNGRLKWEFPTRGWVDASAAIAHDGTVYFGSWDKQLYAVGADGKERWHFATAGEIVSSPAIGLDGTIYFGSHDRNFYALGPDGKARWHYTTEGPILSSPAIGRDGALYFTSVDGNLYALNADGTLRWRTRTGGVTESSPVLGENETIYVGVNIWINAYSPAGKPVWTRGDLEPIEAAPLALANRGAAFISTRGMQMEVDSNSVALCSYYCRYGTYSSAAIGPAGTTYVVDSAFWLCALDSDIPLAASTWPRFRGNPRNTGNVADSLPPPGALPAGH